MAQAASLLQALPEFIQADTWDDSQRILEQRPELLSDQTDALLEELIQAARAQGDETPCVCWKNTAPCCAAAAKWASRAPSLKRISPGGAGTGRRPGIDAGAGAEELVRSGADIRAPEDLQRLLDSCPDLREQQEHAAQAQTASPLASRLQELLALHAHPENNPSIHLPASA